MSRMKELLKQHECKVSVSSVDNHDQVIHTFNVDASDGHLDGDIKAAYRADHRLMIELAMPIIGLRNLIVFRVENVGGDKKHCSAAESNNTGGADALAYRQRMKLKRDPRTGYTVPDRFRNGLCVFFRNNDGSAEIGKVEIVAQDGEFFLSEEIIYSHLAANELPQSFPEYVRETPPDVSHLAPDRGVVLWWGPTAFGGFGCLATPQGNAQVHWTKIVSEERYKRLTPGDRVYIDCLEPTDPEKKSGFKFTAIGVSVVPETELQRTLRLLGG